MDSMILENKFEENLILKNEKIEFPDDDIINCLPDLKLSTSQIKKIETLLESHKLKFLNSKINVSFFLKKNIYFLKVSFFRKNL